MKTVRQLIEIFAYEHMESLLAVVEAEGKSAVYHGSAVFEQECWFVGGEVVSAAARMYAHYVSEGDPRADVALARIKAFTRMIADDPCNTWGKLAILRGLCKLQQAGLLNKLDEETLEILKVKTEYTDFFNKEALCTRGGYPSNYIQVAMACAGIREQLGWERERFMERIRDKLLAVMREGSESGWMDEMPPYGRFDRYSIIVSSELSDTLELLNCELPEQIAYNLREAAHAVLFMANNRGDGINYGRSLSCHGDGAALEILSSALRRGLVEREMIDRAVCYSRKIVHKLLDFWYDPTVKCFNLWWNGRTTNRYRLEFRAFEVNLDMAFHLLNVLENFELAGLSDYVPDDVSLTASDTWQCTELLFRDSPGQVCKTYILRRRDTLVMLPLIGLGSVYQQSAYMPYPAICGKLEAAPESGLPFLVPEYTLEDGTTARPIQYYHEVSCLVRDDCSVITARGTLCVMGDKLPRKSEVGFTAEYTFDQEGIRALFSCDQRYRECRMVIGVHDKADCICPVGFENTIPVTTEGQQDFMTPHGWIVSAWNCTTKQNGSVGYYAVLQE